MKQQGRHTRNEAPAFAAILIPVMLLLCSVACTRETPSPDVRQRLATLARSLGIEIVADHPTFPVQTAHGRIDGQRANQSEIDAYGPLFVSEFTLYPSSLVSRSRLERVVLCTELSFAGQRRNGVPDYERNTLYLDVSRGGYDQIYLRKVIHHEYFHIIDYNDDWSVNEDRRWASLNPARFKYAGGGSGAQESPQTSVLTNRFPGFLNHYSTTAVEEDKAEVFANLVVGHATVDDRAKTDPVLSAKVSLMKDVLSAFCPDIDDAFWKRAGMTERTDR
jgi:hypothetical protein